jgi:DNA-binding NtrC family response regulator
VPATTSAPAGERLDDAMRQHIELALRACAGRVEGVRGVAAMLRINPHTLRARMRKLGIDVSRYRSASSPGPVSPENIEPLDRAMAAHIARALRETRGRVEGPNGAAKRLAINPHTLRARMRKLGVSATVYRPGHDRVAS